ncbi:MAG: hypothetical protein HWN68_09530 [Desulfobacterales bacterium]|nr:hypothetical protein [Desulfobacterales bacterium]
MKKFLIFALSLSVLCSSTSFYGEDTAGKRLHILRDGSYFAYFTPFQPAISRYSGQTFHTRVATDYASLRPLIP